MALYAPAAIPVRDDIDAAHQHLRKRTAEAGTWWDGASRLAMADEARRARHCPLCRERREALSPTAVTGEHQHGGQLPAPAVELVHRLAMDPGRLSRRWQQDLLGRGLTDAQYVEAVGVVARSIGVDAFARGVGLDPLPLPGPVEGEPSRYRPRSAKDEGCWVPMIALGDARGAEADLYPKEGYFPNVGRALSLVPEEVRDCRRMLAAHYLDYHQVADVDNRRTLARPQAELLGTRVSALHDCFY